MSTHGIHSSPPRHGSDAGARSLIFARVGGGWVVPAGCFSLYTIRPYEPTNEPANERTNERTNQHDEGRTRTRTTSVAERGCTTRTTRGAGWGNARGSVEEKTKHMAGVGTTTVDGKTDTRRQPARQPTNSSSLRTPFCPLLLRRRPCQPLRAPRSVLPPPLRAGTSTTPPSVHESVRPPLRWRSTIRLLRTPATSPAHESCRTVIYDQITSCSQGFVCRRCVPCPPAQSRTTSSRPRHGCVYIATTRAGATHHLQPPYHGHDHHRHHHYPTQIRRHAQPVRNRVHLSF
jgi:hypothetical protein